MFPSDAVSLCFQLGVSGSRVRTVNSTHLNELNDKYFKPKGDRDKQDTKFMAEQWWAKNEDGETKETRVRKKPERLDGEGGTQDLSLLENPVENAISEWTSRASKVEEDEFGEADDLLPGQGDPDADNNPNVKWLNADVDVHEDFEQRIEVNYHQGRALINPSYSMSGGKQQPVYNYRGTGFAKSFKALENAGSKTDREKTAATDGFRAVSEETAKFGSKLRILYKLALAQGDEECLADDVELTEDSKLLMAKILDDPVAFDTEPKESDVAEVVDDMHSAVTGFISATTKILPILTKVIDLVKKVEMMESLETTDDDVDNVYFYLPDTTQFNFLNLASDTLRHLQGMIAREVGDRKNLNDWRRKQEFMATIKHHIGAYEQMMKDKASKKRKFNDDDYEQATPLRTKKGKAKK